MNRALVPDGCEHFAVYLEAKTKQKRAARFFHSPFYFAHWRKVFEDNRKYNYDL